MGDIEVIGFCDSDAATLGALQARGDWRGLVGAPGDFVLRIASGNGETLVSSLYSIQPYFLGPNGTHGKSAATLSRGGFDIEAIATLASLSHTIGEQTLAPDVRRIPAASICRWNGQAWSIETLDFASFHPAIRTRPADALDAFRAALAACAGDAPVVSLSGGFDSRAILAGALDLKLRPPLLSMGGSDAADVQAAAALARIANLPLTVRSLDAAAYLANAPALAALTDGQKAADHWHSWFYARDNGFAPNARLLIGGNGEFARTYYLDRGLLPLAEPFADLAADTLKRQFWRARLSRTKFSASQIALMPAPLRQALSSDAIRARAARLTELSPGGVFDGLDWFYLRQRVRHFIGFGMRLVASGMDWRSPFLSRDWITATAGLPRHWKTASNWHRFAIATLAPQLRAVPEAGFSGPMRTRGGALRSRLWQRQKKGAPYADYRNWFQGDAWADALGRVAPALSPVFGEALPIQIAAECRQGRARPETLGLMLALGHWAQARTSPDAHGL